MDELSFQCDECGAKIGQPCKSEKGKELRHLVHRLRALRMDKVLGLNPADRAYTFTPKEIREIEGEGII